MAGARRDGASESLAIFLQVITHGACLLICDAAECLISTLERKRGPGKHWIREGAC